MDKSSDAVGEMMKTINDASFSNIELFES
jgi:hypothetical protein